MIAVIIILIAIALVLVIFTLQNTQGVDVNFLFWTIEQSPLALTLFLSIIMGIIVGAGLCTPTVWRKSRLLKAANKELNKLKAEIEKKQASLAAEPKHKTPPEGERMIENDSDLFK